MERYVIVCAIGGDALKFHDRLTTDVCHRFNKKRTKLPAHFTIKAPFETDNIQEITDILNDFSKANCKAPMKIKGYGAFREDVIYMDVKMSPEAKSMHDALIDKLDKITWINFKYNEGKNKVFHCTILSKRIKDRFKEIWNYVNKYFFDFNEYFDNISLYIWKNNTWILVKRYNFDDKHETT
ncbi:2'-5' RNA ligase family protein [Clostridium sp.]|jgi:2'-5' RNA ligase|uniref:2'-5' RNA ligase family protein n=1 Tax=Clostridium sp. TaxID=1506 RepID=UPI002FDE269F